MSNTFLLEIVTPQRRLLSKEVDEVTAPGQAGQFGVLAGHTPFLTVLKPGEIIYKSGTDTALLAINRGYAEVLPEKTTILVDAATEEHEIDLDGVRAEAREAEEALKTLHQDDSALPKAQDRLPCPFT